MKVLVFTVSSNCAGDPYIGFWGVWGATSIQLLNTGSTGFSRSLGKRKLDKQLNEIRVTISTQIRSSKKVSWRKSEHAADYWCASRIFSAVSSLIKYSSSEGGC